MIRLHKLHYIFIFLLLLSNIEIVYASYLKNFTTDFCTKFPEGKKNSPNLWKDCCVEHDLKYWMGGSKLEKKQADRDLRVCVGDKGEKIIGWIMQQGVNIGGNPKFKTSWRWGYGWINRPNYLALSKEEKQMVRDRLENTTIVTCEMKDRIVNLRFLN